ncbi:DUF926-domain-containing protein [Leucogyrophana mollusca]|uniref:DUF926-domain-containing protein n=1 Tax=Leucogyrophana mollusca TaxID=85980 RepID=A0ACB8B4S3_9AGAM|nr:DUF926-domain-containing protein [Leucogyrophana mollusca]
MATIHPSRMGLVPQDTKDQYPGRRRGRSPSPRARSPRRETRDHRDRDTDRDADKDRRDRDSRRDRSRDRDRSDRRRASPVYSDYRRAPTPPANDGGDAPWRKQENMYPNRQQRDRPPHTGGSFGPPNGGGSEYMESRRLQRETSTINIWPPSPKAPARVLSPVRDSKSRKKSSKRDRSETPTDSSEDEDRRRRERKEKKRARKEKERAERKERKERKSRARNHGDSDDEKNRPRRSRTRSQSRTKSRSRGVRSPSPSRTPSPARASEEDEWVEKPSAVAPIVPSSHTGQSNGSMPPPSNIPSSIARHGEEDSDDEVGPQPLYKVNASKKVDERAYGSALLRGEGSAMAAFLQDDPESRIPRRGEIGLTSDEIAQFESVGYVMSGSRHKRMNAVRMRKENQVISAEEKRGILKLQKEERERREAILREEFSELVNERLKAPEARPK